MEVEDDHGQWHFVTFDAAGAEKMEVDEQKVMEAAKVAVFSAQMSHLAPGLYLETGLSLKDENGIEAQA